MSFLRFSLIHAHGRNTKLILAEYITTTMKQKNQHGQHQKNWLNSRVSGTVKAFHGSQFHLRNSKASQLEMPWAHSMLVTIMLMNKSDPRNKHVCLSTTINWIPLIESVLMDPSQLIVAWYKIHHAVTVTQLT